jgi:NADH-quinone oxidoreductase subunit N
LTGVAQYLGTHVLLRNGVLVAGMAMLLVAFAFKVAAVPFHFWSPDVYEGAPTPVTGLMASIVKVGAFVALVRVLVSALGSELTSWRPIVWALILLTTFVGASVALVQSNVKRLLAYSSINQAGFMLLGIWAGTARGVAGTLYYVMTYAPVVVATFAVVALMGGDKDESHDLDSYRGLARRNPWLGGAFAVLLLAQSGAPFTTGFFAKFSVVAAAVDAGGAPLAVLVMIAAAIAAFFYLRLVLSLFVDTELPAVLVPRMTNVVVIAVAGAAIVFGIWVGPLAELSHHAAALFIPVR